VPHLCKVAVGILHACSVRAALNIEYMITVTLIPYAAAKLRVTAFAQLKPE
jgi:hypothetical protein